VSIPALFIQQAVIIPSYLTDSRPQQDLVIVLKDFATADNMHIQEPVTKQLISLGGSPNTELEDV
jgi:hypothetical protein